VLTHRWAKFSNDTVLQLPTPTAGWTAPALAKAYDQKEISEIVCPGRTDNDFMEELSLVWGHDPEEVDDEPETSGIRPCPHCKMVFPVSIMPQPLPQCQVRNDDEIVIWLITYIGFQFQGKACA
jgi:hypothetical protein